MSTKIVPQTFESEFGSIRVLVDDGEPWFVARDITDALGLDRTATRRLDDDEKGVRSMHTPGGDQEMAFVTEAGLYLLVMASKKPGAKRFKRWVTHEVLPAIRRDGGYMAAAEGETPEQLMARALNVADEAIRRRDARLAAVEPKAAYFDAVMDGERWSSFTEAARYLHQLDRSMTRKRLFELARRDGIITRDRQASRLGIDRGYVANYQPPAYFDQATGEEVRPRPYAKVTGKGLSWMVRRYCGYGKGAE